MKSLNKLFFKNVATIIVLGASSNAFAGGAGYINLTQGHPTAVPTLSGSMLILLSLLLFAVAFRVAQKKNAGKLFMTLIGVSILATGIGGVKLVSDSVATGNLLPQNYSAGESQRIRLNPNDTYFGNANPSLPMTVGLIESDPGYICLAASQRPSEVADGCTLNKVLAPGDRCGVSCESMNGN